MESTIVESGFSTFSILLRILTRINMTFSHFFLSHGSLAWLKLSLLQKLVRGKIGGWPAILTHNFLISAAGVAAPFGLQVYHALEFSYKKGYGNIYIQITLAQHTHICVYIYIYVTIYI